MALRLPGLRYIVPVALVPLRALTRHASYWFVIGLVAGYQLRFAAAFVVYFALLPLPFFAYLRAFVVLPRALTVIGCARVPVRVVPHVGYVIAHPGLPGCS